MSRSFPCLDDSVTGKGSVAGGASVFGGLVDWIVPAGWLMLDLLDREWVSILSCFAFWPDSLRSRTPGPVDLSKLGLPGSVDVDMLLLIGDDVGRDVGTATNSGGGGGSFVGGGCGGGSTLAGTARGGSVF